MLHDIQYLQSAGLDNKAADQIAIDNYPNSLSGIIAKSALSINHYVGVKYNTSLEGDPIVTGKQIGRAHV